MKKLLRGLVLGLLIMLAGTQAFAASSCTQALQCSGNGYLCTLTMTWVAHTDGTFTSVAVDSAKLGTLTGYFLYMVRSDPGTTAPTANWDFTLTDAHGDILGGMGANHSATATESFIPKIDATNLIYGAVPWRTSLTLAISGNSVNAATGVIEFFFVKE